MGSETKGMGKKREEKGRRKKIGKKEKQLTGMGKKRKKGKKEKN